MAEQLINRLHHFLRDQSMRPFQRGQDDCCLLICDWLYEMADISLKDQVRGFYSDESGATGLCFRLSGHRNFVLAFSTILLKTGLIRLSAAELQTSDIVLVRALDKHGHECLLPAIKGEMGYWMRAPDVGLILAYPKRQPRYGWGVR